MRICIYGAGAVGGNMAVRLARAGHEISAIARGEQLAAIRANGLTLVAGHNSWTCEVAATDTPSDLGPQDLIVVAVKATGLAAVAENLRPLLTSKTRVLFLQNGMPWWYAVGLEGKPQVPDLPIFRLVEPMLSVLSPEQVVGGSIYSANIMAEPGVVINNTPASNQTSIGAITRAGEAGVDELRAVLDGAELASPPPAGGDIRSLIWMKLLVNMCGSTLALATGNKSSISRQDDKLGAVYLCMMQEGFRIAAAHGYPLDGLMDPEDFLTRTPDHKPSLLQDYEAGRAMEIAEIVLAPQAFARKAKVDTPSLDAVAAIVTRQARDRGLFELVEAWEGERNLFIEPPDGA